MTHALLRPGRSSIRRIGLVSALALVAGTLPGLTTTAAAAPPAAPAPAPDCGEQPDEASAMAAACACGRAVENAWGRSE